MIAPDPPTMVIALTGGIAAGKSAVARRFSALGVHVLDADVAARAVVEPGTPGLIAIVEAFGSAVLDDAGRLDRPAMRERVFANKAARQRLEGIVHPLVRAWLHQHVAAETGPYCLLAIPLLVENIGHYRWIRQVLLVDVAEAVQIERLMRRDGVDGTLARRMLSQQARRSERIAVADYVIDNTGAEAALDGIIATLHEKYLALAAAQRAPADRG